MSENIQYVSENELVGILVRCQSARAFGIVALTVPSCFSARKGGSRKGSEPACPPVMKRQHVTCIGNFEYERFRNNDNARVWSRQVEALRAEGKEEEARALEQEGPKVHELGGRKDSRKRIEGTPLVRNDKGFVYFQTMIPTGAHPQWPRGRHETSYCYLPDHRGLLLDHWAAYGPKAQVEEYPEDVLAIMPAVEYCLDPGQPNSLADWLKPYKKRPGDPVDADYREYRFDHILEVRHEGVRYIVRRGGQPQAEVA